jgi:hypothetical protein
MCKLVVELLYMIVVEEFSSTPLIDFLYQLSAATLNTQSVRMSGHAFEQRPFKRTVIFLNFVFQVCSVSFSLFYFNVILEEGIWIYMLVHYHAWMLIM